MVIVGGGTGEEDSERIEYIVSQSITCFMSIHLIYTGIMEFL